MNVSIFCSKSIMSSISFISELGGEILIKSEGKSKGSTFYFSLPMTNK